jgi:hypothetical protein
MTPDNTPKFYGPSEHAILRALATPAAHTAKTLRDQAGVGTTVVYTFLQRLRAAGLLADAPHLALAPGVDAESLIASPLISAVRLRHTDYLVPLFPKYLEIDTALPPEQWMSADSILRAIPEYADEASHPASRRIVARYMHRCGVEQRFIKMLRVCAWPVRRVSA